MSSKHLIFPMIRVVFALFAFLLTLMISIQSFAYMGEEKEYGIIETNTAVKEETIKNDHQLEAKIQEHLKELNLSNSSYEIYNINNHLVNVFITVKENNYRSFILDRNNSQRVKITSIIHEEKIDAFNNLIIKYLNQKYPKFIIEGLTTSGEIAYKIGDNNIKVYYSEIITSPQYNGELYITLNGIDLKDIITYDITPLEEIDDNITKLNPNQPTVALTFDDGPADITNNLLEYLNDNLVNATFFILGNRIIKYQDIIFKGLEYGNEYGSHSYSHPYLTKLNNTKLDYQINETNKIFKELTGIELKLLRPPYGRINERIKNRYDMTYIMWSMDTLDWKNRDVLYLKDYVLENITDGDIILFHDIHLTSVEAIKQILPELYVRGIQVTTVSKLAELKAITLEDKHIYRNFKSE